jgi:hypothetical protein
VFFYGLIIKDIKMNKLMFAGLVLLLNIGLVFAHTEKAYITNAASPSSIAMCTLDSLTGQLDSCEDYFLDHLSTPLDIAFANEYAYIANSNYPAFVSQCQINDQGELNTCILSDVPSYSGISFHQSDALYAYLSYGASIVQKCKVSPDGQLENHNCKDSGAGPIFLNGPMYITFKTFNEIDYAYIANGDYQINASVIQCQVESNGDFANCQDSGTDGKLNGAADIDFATIAGKTYAYITQPGGAVAKCDVDKFNGLFSDCTSTGNDFKTPIGITVKTIANTLYAYVVDGGFNQPIANRILQCTVDLLGDLDCLDSGVGDVFSNPFGIGML